MISNTNRDIIRLAKNIPIRETLSEGSKRISYFLYGIYHDSTFGNIIHDIVRSNYVEILLYGITWCELEDRSLNNMIGTIGTNFRHPDDSTREGYIYHNIYKSYGEAVNARVATVKRMLLEKIFPSEMARKINEY